VTLKGSYRGRGHNSTFATNAERLYLRRLPSPQLADIPSADIPFTDILSADIPSTDILFTDVLFINILFTNIPSTSQTADILSTSWIVDISFTSRTSKEEKINIIKDLL